MTKQQKQVSDYLQAKEVVKTLGLHDETLLVLSDVGNFRKYLREHSKYIGKQYVTKKIGEKLQVTRLK